MEEDPFKDRFEKWVNESQRCASEIEENVTLSTVYSSSEDESECSTRTLDDDFLQASVITSCYIKMNGTFDRELIDATFSQIPLVERESGAEIEVLISKRTSEWYYNINIRITGTFEAKNEAKMMVEDLINDVKDPLLKSPVEIQSTFTDGDNVHLGIGAHKEIMQLSVASQENATSWRVYSSSEDESKCSTRSLNDDFLQASIITSCYIKMDGKFNRKIIDATFSQIPLLERESGAEIEVLISKRTSEWYYNINIRITGTFEAKNEAKKMVEDLINNVKDPVLKSPVEIQSTFTDGDNVHLRNGAHKEIMQLSVASQENATSSRVYSSSEDESKCSTRSLNDDFLQASIITSCYIKMDGKFNREIIEETFSQIPLLERESGAEIEVLISKRTSEWYYNINIRITGTFEAKKKARTMVEDLINNVKDPVLKSLVEIPSTSTDRDNVHLESGAHKEIMQLSVASQENETSLSVYSSSEDEYECITRAVNDFLQASVVTSSCIKMNGKYNKEIIDAAFSQILQMQRESGTEIEVFSKRTSECYDENITIRITGTVEGKKKARKMVEDLINKVKDLALTSPVEIQSTSHFASHSSIIKDFYKEDPIVAAMTEKEVDIFRFQNFISVMKKNSQCRQKIPNPVTSFKQAFEHYPELLEKINKQEFTTPTPIQCQAWPILMKGLDMIGVSPPGTGKTIAYLFPVLIHIIGQGDTVRENQVGPIALILAPTKNAVQEIHSEALKYAYHGLKCVCIYGRGSRRYVMKDVDLLITTPQHLYDLSMSSVINLTGVTFLVLDNADQMLKFETPILKLASDIHPDRQVVFITSTWTHELQNLASSSMIKPMKVFVGLLNIPSTISQEIIFVDNRYEDQREIFFGFVKNMGISKILVFVGSEETGTNIANDLAANGIKSTFIHDKIEEIERQQILSDFKSGSLSILIATDLASHPFRTGDITLIFNFTFPTDIDTYVYNVAQSQRFGNFGIVITIFSPTDWKHAKDLIKVLNDADQYVPEKLYDIAEKFD